MRLLLLLCLTLGAARAEIPLQLLAEFDLPPGTGAWDVQHWVDDSTFGWVGVVDTEIRYKKSPADRIHTMTIAPGVCGTDYIGNIGGIAISKLSNGESQFLVHAGLCWDTWDQDCSGYWLHISESGEISCAYAPGYSDESASQWYTIYEAIALPELPSLTERVIVSGSIHTDFDGMGYILHRNQGFACFWPTWPLVNPQSIWSANILRPYAGEPIEYLGGAGSFWEQNIDDMTPPYDPDIFLTSRHRFAVHDTVIISEETCESDSRIEPDTTFGALLCTSYCIATTAVTRAGRRAIIETATVYDSVRFQPVAQCHDAEDGTLLWQQPSIAPNFTVCRNSDEGQLAIEVRGDRFYAYRVSDGALLDSSVQFSGEIKKVFKTGRCESEIITKQGDTIRAYKLVFPPRELTISIAPIGGQIILRWQPIATVSHYRVCRNVDYSDDLCANGEVHMTTDTMMVLTPWNGATQEYYRVTPVFE